MSVSEAGDRYELDQQHEAERIRQQENTSLRAANATLNEEIARLRQQLAQAAISTAVPADGDHSMTAAAAAAPAAAAEERSLPSGA